MDHGKPHLALVIGVAEQQAAINENLQCDAQWRGEAGEDDPAPGASAGVVDGDQTSQPRYHLPLGQAACLDRLGQPGISMPGQRTLNTTKVVVAGQGQRAPSGQSLGELTQGESQ